MFGGTVYQARDGAPVPLVSAVVTMTDTGGKTFRGVTNAVGNFYVPATAGAPAFPVKVALSYGPEGAATQQSMSTFAGRDGSCASCHGDPAGPTSAGHVWLVTDPGEFPGGGP